VGVEGGVEQQQPAAAVGGEAKESASLSQL
jgi:hypothetical protein